MWTARQDPDRCPQCQERVAPYAADCAACGFALDSSRHHPLPNPSEQLRTMIRVVADRLRGPRA